MSSDASAGVFPPVPLPLGVHFREEAVTFTIFSRHAERVWLMLFRGAEDAVPAAEYELEPDTHRFGDVWHIRLPRPLPGRFYLYRMAGSRDGADGRFDPQQWLLDPYARAIAGSPRWGDAWGLAPGQRPCQGPHFPKCVLVEEEYDWEGDRPPRIPLRDTIIYELHVRGYTAHPSSGAKRPGTYAGLIEKLPYIRDLGVTTLELLPIHEFDEMEYYRTGDARRDLRNFWGYSTIAFFAPNGRYAAAGVTGGQVKEFRDLVRAAHSHGLEIVLDVVFNHTAEGGAGGPVWSFKGIDNSVYYLLDGEGGYHNFSGCGNTFNCNHPVVRDFVVDCLRYWVTEMHVDGFRFDLASVLTRGTDGRPLENPPLIERINEDPVLRECKLIAEAWDAAGLYQVGSFPGRRWSEWNGRFRDDVRRFWKGELGTLQLLWKRMAGSPDLYLGAGGTPLKSINYVACHDGFTLHDLTAYDRKHNQANREHNRDGESHNHSFNFGVEGPTDDPAILALRKRQQKNLIATVLTSLGVPMILAGDEFGR
ncbi:MAG TPA: glycogen-debranching protein, partial [Kiritimatiellae bacterium]|nr:glycogen-debranching protein [Kiritimatiellia bacterium]